MPETRTSARYIPFIGPAKPGIHQLFRRIAPIRYGRALWHPRLLWRIARDRRKDHRHLMAEIRSVIDTYACDLSPETLSTYVDSMIMLHYLQKSGVKVFSMMKPPLMESLAEECADLIQRGVEGDFVDVGVWKGGSSMIMKTVSDQGGGSRRVFCLDIFDQMDFRVLDTQHDPPEDQAIIASLELARAYFGTEGVATSVGEIEANFKQLGVSLDGVRFVQGNLASPEFPFERVDRIAMLRIDCDFYTATRNTLQALFPKMAPGGTIIFDDYFLDGFGERLAADELRASLGDVTPMKQVGQSAVWRLST